MQEQTYYVFMSFGSVHTGKNLGCCIIRCADPENANELCALMGLMPAECNQARGYVLSDEDFFAQGMELERFYTTDEMKAMGFTSGT